MLKNSGEKHAIMHFGAKMLLVHGRLFSNSAAKFWSALIDELLAEYAGCRHIVLEAANEGGLEPGLLFPENNLEHELDFIAKNPGILKKVWDQALADLELYGPPGSVGLRIYTTTGEQVPLTLPMDCVDAELFLYLLAWLLEWSDLPFAAWDEPEIKSAFSAVDSRRGFKYLFDFMIAHKPLSEGLLSWRLDLHFKRSNIKPCLAVVADVPPGQAQG